MILVLVETDGDEIIEVSRETITFARRLSADGGGVPIDAVLVAEPSAAVVEQLGQDGVRTVHHAGGDAFAAYSGAAWAAAAQAAREAAGSVVVTAAGTPRGNEVLAHLAARLDVAMAANVIGFEGLSPFVVTRQVVSGAALEEMRLDDRPAVFSVAGHAVEPATAPEATSPTLRPLAVDLTEADLVARVVAVEPRDVDDSGRLTSARVVVGGGRGVGGAEGFDPLLELAGLLDGTLGVSRVVTSLGWRPHHEQVGQTGSRIAPDVYLPCGISGAIQHWAGCASSKVVIAVNTDPEAPMVTKADYAVIGDLHEVVPAVVEEIRRRRA
jgi:electron transfer flavoprotein alpha subunit